MSIEAGLKKLPVLTAGQILDEIYYNPRFALHIKPLLGKKNPYKAVYVDMMKALNNEFDPTVYPETEGNWAVSRSRAKIFVAKSARIPDRQVSGLGQDLDLGLGISIRWRPKPEPFKPIPQISIATAVAMKEVYYETQIPKILPGLMAGIDNEFPETPIEKAMFIGWGIGSINASMKGELNHIIANKSFTFSKEGGISLNSWGWIVDQSPKARRHALETFVPYPGGLHIESTIQIMFDEKLGLTPEDFKRLEVKDAAIKFAQERREALHEMKKEERKERAKFFIAPLVGFVALAFVLPAIVGGGAAGGAAGAGSASAGATGAGAATTGAAGAAAAATGTSLTTKLVGTAITTGLKAAEQDKAEKEAEKARKEAEAKAAAEEAAAQEEIRQIEEETARIKAATAAAEKAASQAEETRQEISRIETETSLTPSEEQEVIDYVKGEPNIVADKVDSLMPEGISSFVKETGRQPTPEEIKAIRAELTSHVADVYSRAMVDDQINATEKLFAEEKPFWPLIAAGVGIPATFLLILALKRR